MYIAKHFAAPRRRRRDVKAERNAGDSAENSDFHPAHPLAGGAF